MNFKDKENERPTPRSFAQTWYQMPVGLVGREYSCCKTWKVPHVSDMTICWHMGEPDVQGSFGPPGGITALGYGSLIHKDSGVSWSKWPQLSGPKRE